jgi:hypothetical protein
MHKSYLYLDIDGVLNNTDAQIKNYGEGGYKNFQKMMRDQDIKKLSLDHHTIDHIISLDWRLCYALCVLLESESITHIIICSSWRRLYNKEQLKLLFLAKGFPEIADKIVDIVSNDPYDTREDEILIDMAKRKFESDRPVYILDDVIKSSEKFQPEALLFEKFQEVSKEAIEHLKIRSSL